MFESGLEENRLTSLLTNRTPLPAMAEMIKEIQAKVKNQLAQSKKEQEAQIEKEKLQEAKKTPLVQMDKWVMTQGKYQGMTFLEIKKDEGYLSYVKYLNEMPVLHGLQLQQLLIYAHRHLEEEPPVPTTTARGSEMMDGLMSWDENSVIEMVPSPVENEVSTVKMQQQELHQRIKKIEQALGSVIQILQGQTQPPKTEAEGP